jgi:murein DD-endopeptidase MepM/ murein hydrolase activator NlpD
MPVDGVRVAQVADTWAAPRGGGRGHQGQDVFAPRGTPVRSATHGIVFEVSDRFTGGRGVMVLGPGGVRTFYTHFDAYADGVREGMAVTPDTVLGYVGTDGNAAGTPPHLHFGAYAFDPETCRHRAFDPLPMMVDRTREAAR